MGHPQSNGRAEKTVDSIKRVIEKRGVSWRTELYNFLHSHQYIPNPDIPRKEDQVTRHRTNTNESIIVQGDRGENGASI